MKSKNNIKNKKKHNKTKVKVKIIKISKKIKK